MMRLITNEKGNIALLTLGLLGVMVLMFGVLLNLVKVYAVKQQASNAAQQASLAATSEIYRAAEEAIEEEDEESLTVGLPDPLHKSLAEHIEDKKTELRSQHPAWSDREIHLEAVDQVLAEKLSAPIDPMHLSLKTRVESHLQSRLPQIQQAVADAVTSDGGVLTGTQIKINSQYRVEVRTSSRYKAFKYDDLIPEDKRQIYQVGMGPELSFLRHVDWSI